MTVMSHANPEAPKGRISSIEDASAIDARMYVRANISRPFFEAGRNDHTLIRCEEAC